MNVPTYIYLESKGARTKEEGVIFAKQFSTYAEAKQYFDSMVKDESGMTLNPKINAPDRFKNNKGVLFEITTAY